MPNRLQPPLWRSPPVTPSGARPVCHHQNAASSGSSHNDAVKAHKQEISRHRHHWERPTTPPGYWNIGFPTTQEAEQINEEAREMHRKKREHIEAEAQKENGRYKKR